tara:strand:+ start:34361 stop:34753 length:393 start_codon:yes stop_codon:yes gene_type:complete
MDNETEDNLWRDRCLKHPNIMFGTALKNARKRAGKRSMPFNISRDYIIELFESQLGKCYYSGIDINVVKKDPKTTIDPFKMTLDCIDPQKGYVEENVVWCAYCINSMKQKMTRDDLIKVCKAVVSFSGAL